MREHSSILFMGRQSVAKILYVTIMTVLYLLAMPDRRGIGSFCICRGAVNLPVTFVAIAFRFVCMTIVIVSRDLRPTATVFSRLVLPYQHHTIRSLNAVILSSRTCYTI